MNVLQAQEPLYAYDEQTWGLQRKQSTQRPMSMPIAQLARGKEPGFLCRAEQRGLCYLRAPCSCKSRRVECKS